VKLSTRCVAQLGLFAAFVVLAASVSALVLVPRHSKPVAVADVGTVAPTFELSAADGQTFNLADTRGQVVVLFFSALNDPLITQYYDHVDRLARQYADDGRIKILGITGKGPHLDPLLFQLDQRISTCAFPTLLDDNSNVATRYCATGTPLMVIIDPHGVVRYRGPMDSPTADFASSRNTFIAEAIRNMVENATLASANR
jgi:peroxiredoxin